MAATVIAAASAFPENVIGNDEVRDRFRQVFGGRVPDLETYCAMVDHAGIESRHLAVTTDEVCRLRPLREKNDFYARECRRLGERAARECLRRAGLEARDVDCLITVSCTGFMIPSLDAYLVNRLGFPEDVIRMPITEMGCAAGAWSLGRARERAAVSPEGRTLIVSVELPSLTFQPDDLSAANLVSSVLFGDGAAAVLVSTRGERPGPRLLESRSVLFKDSTGLMGFDLREDGFHIVLDRKIPFVIAREARPRMLAYLKSRGLSPADIGFWVIHPGGKKILDSIAETLELGERELAPTLSVWRNRGNLSSATVLCVLEELLRKPPPPGSRGFGVAFGPGFSMEMLLMEWDGGA